jgi:hypothetical protein
VLLQAVLQDVEEKQERQQGQSRQRYAVFAAAFRTAVATKTFFQNIC